MTVEKEIKKAMKEKKLLIGTKSVLRGVKENSVKYVIRSSNCREELVKDLGYYSRNFGLEVRKFSGNSRQLGEICARPFNVMLLGIKN